MEKESTTTDVLESLSGKSSQEGEFEVGEMPFSEQLDAYRGVQISNEEISELVDRFFEKPESAQPNPEELIEEIAHTDVKHIVRDPEKPKPDHERIVADTKPINELLKSEGIEKGAEINLRIKSLGEHRYKIIEKVGRGGQAIVFLAELSGPEQEGVPQRVVIKAIDFQESRLEDRDPKTLNPKERQIFQSRQAGKSNSLREIYFTRELSLGSERIDPVTEGLIPKFRGVTRLKKEGRNSDVILLSIDFIEGADFERMTRAVWKSMPESGPERDVTLRGVIEQISKIAKGIQELHSRGIAHKDIKPKNLINRKDSNNITILDFGIAEPFFYDPELADIEHEAGDSMEKTVEKIADALASSNRSESRRQSKEVMAMLRDYRSSVGKKDDGSKLFAQVISKIKYSPEIKRRRNLEAARARAEKEGVATLKKLADAKGPETKKEFEQELLRQIAREAQFGEDLRKRRIIENRRQEGAEKYKERLTKGKLKDDIFTYYLDWGVKGSPRYMPPECAYAEQDYSLWAFQSDLYSLGMMTARMIYGNGIFTQITDTENVVEWAHKVLALKIDGRYLKRGEVMRRAQSAGEKELAEIILKITSPDPRGRGRIDDLVADLDRIQLEYYSG